MADTSNITIRETGDGLGIYNPATANLPVVLFLCVWLTGWGVGEIFAIWALVEGPGLGGGLFLLFWLTFWTIGGVSALAYLLWQLVGVEKLFITSGAMVRETSFRLFTRRKVWNLADISNVRLATPKSRPRSNRKAAAGGIQFDAGGATHGFGGEMNKADSEAVLAAVQRHLPAGKTEKQALANIISGIARIKRSETEAR